jgi:hypothetical protein
VGGRCNRGVRCGGKKRPKGARKALKLRARSRAGSDYLQSRLKLQMPGNTRLCLPPFFYLGQRVPTRLYVAITRRTTPHIHWQPRGLKNLSLWKVLESDGPCTAWATSRHWMVLNVLIFRATAHSRPFLPPRHFWYFYLSTYGTRKSYNQAQSKVVGSPRPHTPAWLGAFLYVQTEGPRGRP